MKNIINKSVLFISIICILVFVGCSKETPVNANADENTTTSAITDSNEAENNNVNDANSEEDKNKEDTDSVEIKTDSGRYKGLLDDNTIEVKITGVPDDNPAKTFIIEEGLRNEFEKIPLQKDSEILFEYYVNENNENIITRISIFGK